MEKSDELLIFTEYKRSARHYCVVITRQHEASIVISTLQARQQKLTRLPRATQLAKGDVQVHPR